MWVHIHGNICKLRHSRQHRLSAMACNNSYLGALVQLLRQLQVWWQLCGTSCVLSSRVQRFYNVRQAAQASHMPAQLPGARQAGKTPRKPLHHKAEDSSL